MSNALLYVITVLIWGSTWFAIEFQLGTVAPEVSIVYRYVGATSLLFTWAGIRGLKLRFAFRDHLWFMLLGVLLFGLNYVLAYRAQIHITSGLSAIAFSTMVWMNILNARLFFGIRVEGRVLLGALLGIAGILTLFLPQISELALTDSLLFGSLLAIMGALVASFGNMASQAAQHRKLPVIQSNAWGMFYGMLFSASIAAAQQQTFNFEWSVSYVSSLAYLSLFGSVFAFGAYLTLLGRIGAHRAGYAMVLFPVVALILSTLFEGLRLDATLLIGTLLVLTGNVLVLKKDLTGWPLARVVPGTSSPDSVNDGRVQARAHTGR
ncbi:MAG: EamA family transporter [Proteobacteria bacterium]|nr:EamA family transporter [Pseudomonadota bacterium]MDA1064088.1 EamA family transporter [Pseudomonadota bacterium]